MKHDRNDEAGGAVIASLLERLGRLVRSAENASELNPAQWEALRYFSRANRFSNSPTGLTRYLGATKGTISQTVSALERKGYVSKQARPGERRSISLAITEKGHAALQKNPWIALERDLQTLGGKTRRRMERGLRSLLDTTLTAGGHPSFGSCSSCAHLSPSLKCAVFKESMRGDDSRRLCIAHETRND